MTGPEAPGHQESPSIWQFIPLADYRRPSEPARETVRKGILGLWDKLGGGARKQEEPLLAVSDLGSMPQDLLNRVALAPFWGEAVPALAQALTNCGAMEYPLTVMVGAPHSGIAEIVKEWASRANYRLIAAPSHQEILAGGQNWLQQFDTGNEDDFWVIPSLAHCYLRHGKGLTLLRALLDRLGTRSHRCLVACDTWAWAYLDKIMHIASLFPQPLILQAFDQERLEPWFQSLVSDPQGQGVLFRQADNGRFVLPPPVTWLEERGQGSAESKPNSYTAKLEKTTDFLGRAAAYSRGIPGVAYAVWRYSLQQVRHEDKQESVEKAVATGDHPTIWVKPWGQLNFLGVPGTIDRSQTIMVCQALLLHDGLPLDLLALLLPFAASQIRENLQILAAAGLVQEEQKVWRVTALGYPAVRQFLNSEGYLVDAI